IPLLAHHFLDKYARKKDIKGFNPDAMKAMRTYAWQGNVCELENTIERDVVMARGYMVNSDDLRHQVEGSWDLFEVGMTLKAAERVIVERTLDACDGNISETARMLDVSRRWLHYRLKEWENGSS